MKVATSDRLKELMQMRGLRQADILEKIEPYCREFGVKIPRNALSQYITGKVKPKQDKLSILGMALGVSEVWLMGYDVPMEREEAQTPDAGPVPGRDEIAMLFEGLSPENQKKVLDYVRALSVVQKVDADSRK